MPNLVAPVAVTATNRQFIDRRTVGLANGEIDIEHAGREFRRTETATIAQRKHLLKN